MERLIGTYGIFFCLAGLNVLSALTMYCKDFSYRMCTEVETINISVGPDFRVSIFTFWFIFKYKKILSYIKHNVLRIFPTVSTICMLWRKSKGEYWQEKSELTEMLRFPTLDKLFSLPFNIWTNRKVLKGHWNWS